MIQVFLFFLIVIALVIMLERKAVRVIICLGVYSLISSICFLVFGAPDVAMAEACTAVFSTIFFLVCLEKYLGVAAKAQWDSNEVEPVAGNSTTNVAVSIAAPVAGNSTTNAAVSIAAPEAANSTTNAAAPVASNTETNKAAKKAAKKAANKTTNKAAIFRGYILPLGLTVALFSLFILFIPDTTVNTSLKDQYLSSFSINIGGENSVTAIYLGYRMYDTVFEALMLLVSLVAVSHLSLFSETSVNDGKRIDMGKSDIPLYTIRIICPVMLVFGVYLILNGHISPGGGFQGGIVLASFFICRYMIFDMYDINIETVITMEKLVFAGIVILAVLYALPDGSGVFGAGGVTGASSRLSAGGVTGASSRLSADGVTGGISGLSASGFTGGIPELNAAAAAGIGSGVGLGPEVAAVTRSISGSGGAAGFGAYLPIPKVIYLIIMNILIGLKVACSFFSIFYRFTAFERR